MTEKKVLGYCRVSSEEQAAHGISIEAQHEMLKAWATMTQSGTIQIYSDPGFSGKNMNRPQLKLLLKECEAGCVSHVVVWKLDRLSRSLRDTLTVIEDLFLPRGITLVSVTEQIDTSTPSGRMMLNMLASFAQLEREQDSDRVVMAHKHLARDCKYLGGHIPVGYMVDETKHYQLDPETWPTVRHAFEMYLSGEGYTDILKYMNQLTLVNFRKRPFSKQDLIFMLSNEIYAGTYIRKIGADPRHRVTSPETIRIPGGVPALLTPEEWTRVCQIREKNKTTAARYNTRQIFPLTGIVYCAVCGKPMRVNYAGKDRNGTVQRYYECREKCIRPARLEQINAAVFTVVENYAAVEDTIRKASTIANQYADNLDMDNAKEANALEKQLIDLRIKNARIVSFISSTDNPPASLMTELRQNESDQAKLTEKINALRRGSTRYDVEKTITSIKACIGIKNKPPEEQRKLIQAACYKVLVSATAYKVIFNWHTDSGDEPPHTVCQSIRRKN